MQQARNCRSPRTMKASRKVASQSPAHATCQLRWTVLWSVLGWERRATRSMSTMSGSRSGEATARPPRGRVCALRLCCPAQTYAGISLFRLCCCVPTSCTLRMHVGVPPGFAAQALPSLQLGAAPTPLQLPAALQPARPSLCSRWSAPQSSATAAAAVAKQLLQDTSAAPSPAAAGARGGPAMEACHLRQHSWALVAQRASGQQSGAAGGGDARRRSRSPRPASRAALQALNQPRHHLRQE
jgi:hypothetical protein